MFKLLKAGLCYTPEYTGKRDILVAGDKICLVNENICEDCFLDMEVFDCSDKFVCPGFIDQHVHIIGGGGEEGPASRIPEIMLTDIITAGVTTVVGVLGVDSITRNIAGLLAKAKALQAEGINTYIYTGSYSVPTATLTGRVISDLALIDKVIGVGEIAISDNRSSYPSLQELKEIASEARVGGLLGDKAGIIHIHLGDGKDGLNPLLELIEKSDFSKNMFIPTHLNRNKKLFGDAIEYARGGGNIDLTAGENSPNGYSVPDALEILIKERIDMGKVTITSDGNGSIPSGEGKLSEVGKVVQLFEDIKICILDKKIDMEVVLKTVSSNPAKILKLYPRKGCILNGSDADILVLNRADMSINKLFISGEVFIDNGVVMKKGRYER